MLKFFAFILISTPTTPNIDEVAAIPGDDVPIKEDDAMKLLPQRELPWFSLGCVLFKDLGCDSECFVIADAFGYLGAGVCVEDNRCDCGYTINPTLKGIWEQKFPQSIEILDQIIKSDGKLANNIHITLTQGFRTTQESQDDLKPYLSDKQFNKLILSATDSTPADKFISFFKYNLIGIQEHVDEKLPIALKWRDDDLTAAQTQYEHRLIQTLYKTDESYSQLEQIVNSVRRVKNETLNSIVRQFLMKKKTNIGSRYQAIAAIDKISSIIVDELVKRVDKGTIQFVVSWIRTKFTSLLNNFCTVDNDQSVSEVLATPGPISHDWRKHGITIRYRRNYRGDVNLAWVKNSDRVCISIYAEDAAVSQSWMFGGNVTISLFGSPEVGFTQYWKFGSLISYHKYNGGPSEGEWNYGVPYEDLLNDYKKKIEEWCTNNDFLIDTKSCIIYKNTEPDI